MPYLGIPYCETLLLHKHFKCVVFPFKRCEQQTLNYEIKRKINIIWNMDFPGNYIEIKNPKFPQLRQRKPKIIFDKKIC